MDATGEALVVVRCSEWSALEFYSCSGCSMVFASKAWCEHHEASCLTRFSKTMVEA